MVSTGKKNGEATEANIHLSVINLDVFALFPFGIVGFSKEKRWKKCTLCILGLPFNFIGFLFITIHSEQHYDCIVQHPRFVALSGSARGVF